MEVNNFTQGICWNEPLLEATISLEMSEYVVKDIRPCSDVGNDVPCG